MAKPVFATNDVPTASQFNSWLVNVNFARKANAQSVTNSLTLQNDNELFVALEANAIYRMEAMLYYSSSSTSADFKILFRTPSGGSMSGGAIGIDSGGTTAFDTVILPISGNGSNAFGTLGSGTQLLMCHGMVITSGTAGNFQVEWAQNTANASSTTVGAGSYIDLRRVS